MIDAKELRIGNRLEQGIVNHIGYTEGYFRCGILENEYCSKMDFYKYDELTPIPLTEEILLKCKFQELNEFENTCIDKENFIEISSVLEDEFYIGKNKETGGYHFLTIDTFQGDDLFFKIISAPMQYLHTLQNYYPTFKGEELEINL